MLCIYGKDLIKVAKHTDLDPAFVEVLDPEGWNIVISYFPHHTTKEIRAEIMFKVLENTDPVESTVTISSMDWYGITKLVETPIGTTVH